MGLLRKFQCHRKGHREHKECVGYDIIEKTAKVRWHIICLRCGRTRFTDSTVPVLR